MSALQVSYIIEEVFNTLNVLPKERVFPVTTQDVYSKDFVYRYKSFFKDSVFM